MTTNSARALSRGPHQRGGMIMFSGYHMEEAYDDLLFGERPQEGDIYTVQ